MNITLNHNQTQLDAITVTVRELLTIKRFTFKMLVIKVNGVLVKKDQYEHFTIHENDDVQVIHLVSGG